VNRPIPLSADSAALTLVEVLSRVPAGFPSPAQDHTQKRIDLNEVLVLNPVATFLFQVEGDSMVGARIFDGDRLIVDRSVEALHGRIVLACVDDEFTVKTLYRRGRQVRLLPANPAYEPITFVEGQELTVWGVVTWNLRQVLHAQRK
jgi:DNA polymerase V